MLTTLLGVLTSGGFGAITGLIGGFMQKREQRKLLELSNAHDLAMANVDLQRDQAEREHALLVVEKNIEVARVEGEIAEDIRDADAFVESIRSADKPSGSHFMDAIKAAMRPLLTLLLMYITYDIYQQLNEIIGGLEKLDPKMVQELYVYVIHSIIFLTILAISWWFASRGEKAVAAIKGMIRG
jgi:hypothetical protein